MNKDQIRPFRLAFREEGDFVNCYLAKLGTMEGSILLASMRLKLMDAPEMFDNYKRLMQTWATPVVEDIFGETPIYEEERAPEHERSGKA